MCPFAYKQLYYSCIKGYESHKPYNNKMNKNIDVIIRICIFILYGYNMDITSGL